MKYNICIATHKGNVRVNNEDNFYCNGLFNADISKEQLYYEEERDAGSENIFAVFDGMGGEKFGNLASLEAAKTLKMYVELIQDRAVAFSEEAVIRLLNDNVCKLSRQLKSKVGSTATILRLNTSEMRTCNVGDSRAYLFRNNKLHQLTQDHTLEADRKRMEQIVGISKGQVNSKFRNVLTQHLGIEEDDFILEPFISAKIPIREEDIILLCSDGVTHMLENKDICKILCQQCNLNKKRDKIMEEILKAGAKDNITVILIEII